VCSECTANVWAAKYTAKHSQTRRYNHTYIVQNVLRHDCQIIATFHMPWNSSNTHTAAFMVSVTYANLWWFETTGGRIVSYEPHCMHLLCSKHDFLTRTHTEARSAAVGIIDHCESGLDIAPCVTVTREILFIYHPYVHWKRQPCFIWRWWSHSCDIHSQIGSNKLNHKVNGQTLTFGSTSSMRYYMVKVNAVYRFHDISWRRGWDISNLNFNKLGEQKPSWAETPLVMYAAAAAVVGIRWSQGLNTL